MQCKIIISTIVFSFVHLAIYGQYSFDSVKICHSNNELKRIVVGEYEVKMKERQLFSLISKDSAVNYEAGKKMFTLKNLIKEGSLSIKLLAEGVLVSTKDTSFLLSSPTSPSPVSSGTSHVESIYAAGNFSFFVQFKNNKLSRMGVPATDKYVSIDLVQIGGIYTWDFTIESAEYLNRVLLAYNSYKPYLLSIHDDKNKVGVRLIATKKNGIFTELVGQVAYKDDSFAVDNSYILKYTNDGRLKRNTSKFRLVCEESNEN